MSSRQLTLALTPQRSIARWGWLILILYLVGIYFLVNFGLPLLLSPNLLFYGAQPVLWGLVGVLAYAGLQSTHSLQSTHPETIWLGALVGACQVFILILAGLFLGLGESPYSHHLLALLGNILYLVTSLLAFELSRTFLARTLVNKAPVLGLLLPALFFTLISIPPGQFHTFSIPLQFIEFSGKFLLPYLAENLFATFLALTGGPWAALAYRSLPALFEWLSPVLPDLPWLIKALLGTLAPIFGLLIVNSATVTRSSQTQARSDGRGSVVWVILLAGAVALLWFNLGLFGVQPFLVSGSSMQPTLYAGDIVITRPVATESVQIGDVIRFREANYFVVHRVIDIDGEPGNLVFTTRGDNNDHNDDPVPESHLEGKMIVTIPKLGWAAILARRAVLWIMQLAG